MTDDEYIAGLIADRDRQKAAADAAAEAVGLLAEKLSGSLAEANQLRVVLCKVWRAWNTLSIRTGDHTPLDLGPGEPAMLDQALVSFLAATRKLDPDATHRPD